MRVQTTRAWRKKKGGGLDFGAKAKQAALFLAVCAAPQARALVHAARAATKKKARCMVVCVCVCVCAGKEEG